MDKLSGDAKNSPDIEAVIAGLNNGTTRWSDVPAEIRAKLAAEGEESLRDLVIDLRAEAKNMKRISDRLLATDIIFNDAERQFILAMQSASNQFLASLADAEGKHEN